FPAGYQSGVEAYLQDVALDSGKTSSPYGAISQYTDGGGAAQYNVTYGGSVLVTDSAPTPDPSCFDGSTCIMDYQLAIEAEAVRSAQGWNLGLGDQYVILTPPNVTTCFDEFGDCSDNVYCAYHSYEGSTLNPLIYLHIPFEPADPCHSDGFTV